MRMIFLDFFVLAEPNIVRQRLCTCQLEFDSLIDIRDIAHGFLMEFPLDHDWTLGSDCGHARYIIHVLPQFPCGLSSQ